MIAFKWQQLWLAGQSNFFFFKGNLYLVVHDLALSTDSFFKGPYRKANIIIFAKLHILFVTWRNWIGLFYVRHFHCRWRVSEWTKNLHSNNFLKTPLFLQYYITFSMGFGGYYQRHVAFFVKGHIWDYLVFLFLYTKAKFPCFPHVSIYHLC